MVNDESRMVLGQSLMGLRPEDGVRPEFDGVRPEFDGLRPEFEANQFLLLLQHTIPFFNSAYCMRHSTVV